MLSKKIAALMLTFCLLAGCAASAGPSAPESVSPPAESPAPEAPAPQEPAVLPQEDPERPGDLAGTQGYYTPGNRLTLYAMAPERGALRVVRDNDFWNGREVESVSPDGRWLLLSSWDGAPGRRVVALSLYDVERDLLVNLTREGEETLNGSWSEKHWFLGMSTYRFTDKDTFYYQGPCDGRSDGKLHLHRYDIGEDGQVTFSLVELECPPRESGWESGFILLPEQGKVLCDLRMGEDSFEWFTWELESGKLLSRVPEKNGWASSGGLYRDGVLYDIDEEWEQETFHLTAYHMDTDRVEVLASGAIPKAPGMENEPIDGWGVQELVWLEELREDGTFVIRSAGEEIRYQAAGSYREAVWDPAAGGEIRFGEPISAPTFPVEEVRGYTPVFVTAPEGEGLYLPIPQNMAEYYRERYGRPYPIATLPTGELLFLAAEPGDTLPQEDPERPGQLAGSGDTGSHRLALYAMEPEGGGVRMVQEENFWNGTEIEDISPSGNRLLLASRIRRGEQEMAALSVYDILQNRLTNFATYDYVENERKASCWFPGDYRYRFVSEETSFYTFLYEELTYDTTAKQYYLPRWCLAGYELNGWKEWLAPRLPKHPNLPCIYRREEQTILCDLPLESGTQRFIWQVDAEARNNNGGRRDNLLLQTPVENAPPLQQYQTRPPEPPTLPHAVPKGMGTPRVLATLPTGELLFLAKTIPLT